MTELRVVTFGLPSKELRVIMSLEEVEHVIDKELTLGQSAIANGLIYREDGTFGTHIANVWISAPSLQYIIVSPIVPELLIEIEGVNAFPSAA